MFFFGYWVFLKYIRLGIINLGLEKVFEVISRNDSFRMNEDFFRGIFCSFMVVLLYCNVYGYSFTIFFRWYIKRGIIILVDIKS